MKYTKKINFSRFIIICTLSMSLFNSFGQSKDPSLANGAMIGNKNSGKISKQELLQWGKLKLSDSFSTDFQIISFTMTRVEIGEEPIETKSESNGEFTNKMKDLIDTAIKGDKLYFEYITCSGNDGTIIKLKALSFIIE